MQKQIVVLCLIVTAYTLFFLNLPPWWDGTTTAITAIDTAKADMNPYMDFFGKPPFIFVSLGLLFKLFGYSTAIIHVYMLMFSLGTIIFTYKVGELLSGKDMAVIASSLLVFSPLFIAQSINLNFDLPGTALIMASYYFLLKKNYVAYAISGTMLVLTKEVGILFIAAVVSSTVINFVLEGRQNNEKNKTSYIAQMVPVFVFILWAYGNFTRRGWFIFPRDSPILKMELILNDNFFTRLEQLFIINFNWIITLILIFSAVMWMYRQRSSNINYDNFRPLLPLVLFTFIFFIAVMPIRDFNLPRYLIVLYPLFYLASSRAMFNLFGNNKKLVYGVFFSIIILFAAQTVYDSRPFVFLDPVTHKIYGTNSYSTLGGSEVMEINLKYVDYAKADIELVSFLDEMNSSAPLILNRFNHYSIFKAANTGIDLGYGQKSSRQYFTLKSFYEYPDKVKLPAILIIEHFNKYDLERLYDMYNVRFIKRISVHDAGADVYWINN